MIAIGQSISDVFAYAFSDNFLPGVCSAVAATTLSVSHLFVKLIQLFQQKMHLLLLLPFYVASYHSSRNCDLPPVNEYKY